LNGLATCGRRCPDLWRLKIVDSYLALCHLQTDDDPVPKESRERRAQENKEDDEQGFTNGDVDYTCLRTCALRAQPNCDTTREEADSIASEWRAEALAQGYVDDPGRTHHGGRPR
jgi:hypothetical protein